MPWRLPSERKLPWNCWSATPSSRNWVGCCAMPPMGTDASSSSAARRGSARQPSSRSSGGLLGARPASSSEPAIHSPRHARSAHWPISSACCAGRSSACCWQVRRAIRSFGPSSLSLPMGAGRRWSSSRTSTGPTRRHSTSSASWDGASDRRDASFWRRTATTRSARPIPYGSRLATWRRRLVSAVSRCHHCRSGLSARWPRAVMSTPPSSIA